MQTHEGHLKSKKEKMIQSVITTAEQPIVRMVDEFQEKYCKDVEDVILNDNRLGILKGFESAMRSGKTHMAIQHHIPFLFKNDPNLKLVFITAPLTGIVEDNRMKLKVMCRQNGFDFLDHPNELDEYLYLDGVNQTNMKLVIYMTNQMAWVQPAASRLFKTIGNEHIGGFIDESQVWTVDNWKNTKEVNGYSGNPKYQAKLYETVSLIAAVSPHIYCMSATPNPQFKGYVKPIKDDMSYEVVVTSPPAKEIAHRLAWFGEVTFHTGGSTIIPSVSLLESFQKMLDSMMSIENKTGYKRSAMIECNRKGIGDENPENFPISKFKELIQHSNYFYDGMSEDDLIGGVMVSGGMYAEGTIKSHLFSKSGKEDYSLSTQVEFMRKVDDENDPLRFILVIDMLKMGVTLRTVKEFFSCRETELANSSMIWITHQVRQKLGRPMTPNVGIPTSEFYRICGGDVRAARSYDPMMNSYNYYLHDNLMNHKAVKEIKENYPSFEDFKQINDNYCPMCGRNCVCESLHNQNDINYDILKDDLNLN